MKLFPALKPFKTHHLKVSDLHQLYVEECGSPGKIPILFIHGGPGAGCSESHRRYFDPQKFHIILFDQRGCGKSTPHAELKSNNTHALIEDIEKIRVLLGIQQWVIFGGSWGSTLALLYAQSYPERILHLILRGIFLCRKKDIDWFYQSGTSHLFPDAWAAFVEPIADQERDNMIAAYYSKLTSENELIRMSAAKAWSVWEASTMTLERNYHLEKSFADPYFALSFARIECHYFINQCFIEDNQILNNMEILKDVPGSIVHGRYDVICPLEQAYLLHQAWGESTLDIIENAGHALFEEGISDKIMQITDRVADQLS